VNVMPSRGIVYMAGSALAFSVTSLLVKIAIQTIPVVEIVFVRLIVTLGLSWIVVRRAGISPWGNNKLGLAFRGFVGYFALTAYLVSLDYLGLAEATTIQNTAPLLTAALAWWVLDEKVGWSTAFAIICGVGGVLLIVNAKGEHYEAFGIAVAIVSVVLSAIAYVTIRKISRTEHALVIVFYFSLVGTPLAMPWAIAAWVTPTAVDWLLLILIGLSTQAVQVLQTKGLALERAGRAISVNYLQVAFSIILQWAVFAEAPTIYMLAGAALIFCGTYAVARSSSRDPVPKAP
jgi:drug/metabolite transporter (DMT)-like permease